MMHYAADMSRLTSTRLQPLSMRLPADDLALIDRAAKQQGRARTEFMRNAAVEAAERALLEGPLVRMSPAGFKAFARAVAGEGKPVSQLLEVLRRPAPWK
jgi:uncharacterized protein (DUF1778 family)